MSISDYLEEGVQLLSEARGGSLDGPVEATVSALVDALRGGKGVLICGNGGSAADAMHIAGELVGRYLLDRPAYKVVALGTDPAITTAWSNDFEYESLLARQVEALGEAGGVLWGISTSGNSENVVRAMAQARQQGMTTIALTGQGGGRMADADILVPVETTSTPRIQEIHTYLYHYICEQVERRMVQGG